MKIKICGIRDKANIEALDQVAVDYVGLIFYPKSKRYFFDGNAAVADVLELNKQRVGVFVNESIDKIKALAEEFKLSVVQLHGDESVAECAALKEEGYQVWKAFSVSDQLPDLAAYRAAVDAFLFDTKGKEYGGNGVRFDWSALTDYSEEIPFVLSGGIDPEDVEMVKGFSHSALEVLDLNSRFESAPGLKDMESLKAFVAEIKK